MKRVLGLVLAGIISLGVAAVFAGGDGCCMRGKATASDTGACADMTSKLKLTDEQKGRIATLRAECRKAASTSECRAMMSAGLEKILTPEQLAQCKADCEKAKTTGHCTMKADKKS